MKFLSGILLGIFSIVLILVQGLFVTWSIAYPEGLFFFTTVFTVISTIILFVSSMDKK